MGNLISRSTPPEDYEKILSELTGRISRLQTSLTQTRLHQRRMAIIILGYGSLLYLGLVLWVGLFGWFRGSEEVDESSSLYSALSILTLLVAPFLLWYVHRVVKWLYGRKISIMEDQLHALRTQQKQKIEELKKVTLYYQTRGLLERFDTENNEVISKQEQPIAIPETSKETVTSHVQEVTTPTALINSSSIQPAASSSLPTPTNLIPQQQPQNHSSWLDRLMDAVLGDDRNSRYALVCQRCFAHNGLCPPEEYDSIKYHCHHCHYFNDRDGLLRGVKAEEVIVKEYSNEQSNNPSLPEQPSEESTNSNNNETPKQQAKRAATLRKRTSGRRAQSRSRTDS